MGKEKLLDKAIFLSYSWKKGGEILWQEDNQVEE